MTTNYVASTMTQRRTATARLDEWPEMYEWPEGVTMHTWRTDTITDVKGVGCLKSYVECYGGSADGESCFLLEAWYSGAYTLATSWEGVRGVLRVTDDYTNPREAAGAFLEEYSAWATGDVWVAVVLDAYGAEVDTMYGFYAEEAALEAAREMI